MGELDLDAMGRMGVPMPSAKEGVLNSLADIVRLRSAGWGWKAVSAWLYGNRSVFVLDAAGGLSARPVGQTTVRDYVLTALPADSDEGRAVRGRFKGLVQAAPKPVVGRQAISEAPKPQAKTATVASPERKDTAASMAPPPPPAWVATAGGRDAGAKKGGVLEGLGIRRFASDKEAVATRRSAVAVEDASPTESDIEAEIPSGDGMDYGMPEFEEEDLPDPVPPGGEVDADTLMSLLDE